MVRMAGFQSKFGFVRKEYLHYLYLHLYNVYSGLTRFVSFRFVSFRSYSNTRFDNEYYTELVGSGDTVERQVEGAPQWRQNHVDNTGEDFPDRFQWEGFPGGRRVVMLNTDIALVRQLTDDNKDSSTGHVGCSFVSRDPTRDSICPVAHSSVFEHMVRYRNDNMAFLVDFRDAMIKMTNVGYEEDNCDESNICTLRKKG
jgi:hypothetical protein